MTAASKTIHNPDRVFDYVKAANQYRDLIEDMAAFVRFAYDEGMSEGAILSTLVHDISGTERHGLDSYFSPRVTGYAEDEANVLS